MRWVVPSAGVIVAAVLAPSGCAGGTSDADKVGRLGTTEQAIQGGVTDANDKFAVGICIGSNCSATCSGALILPNVVATARHCVEDTPEVINCSENPTFGSQLAQQFSVTTNTSIDGTTSGWYSVKSFAVPDDNHICGNDIALLILSKSLPSTIKPITPSVKYFMWDPAAKYDRTFSAIGYGATSPSGGESGTRRIRESIKLLCVPGSPSLPCDPSVPASEFIAGNGTCSGDSGSSAFESSSLGAGTPVSFGVLSRGSDTADTCGTAVYSRFDKHRDWILQVAQEASNDWSLYAEPSWTTFEPEPDPPVDAGTKKDGGTNPSTKADLGASCKANVDCSSNLCVDLGDATSVCSKACDEENPSCPESFECRDSFCLSPVDGESSGAESTTKKVTTSSCAAAPRAATVRPIGSNGTTLPTWPGIALALASVAAARRARRGARTG